MSWSIVVHEDEIRPVLFMQGHNDWINDVIQVVWTCYCTIHKVLGSSVMTRHTCPHCNTTTTKGSSGWCIALSLMSPTSLATIISSQHELIFIREQHWSRVQNKRSLAHARRWHLCLVVWSGTLAGRLARRPRWCKRFRTVWRDTWAPLTSLKCAWSCVAFIIRFRRALFTMKRSSVWDVAKQSTSTYFCDSSSLSVPLLQPADDTLWHSKLSGHIRLRTSCLKPGNGEVLLINC